MCEHIRTTLIFLFMSYYRKNLTVSGCQLCIRQILATPLSRSSRTISTHFIEIPANSLASPGTIDSYCRRATGQRFPQWSMHRLKRGRHHNVVLYERNKNENTFPQPAQDSAVHNSFFKPDINGTNFDASNVTDSSGRHENPMSLAMISTIGFYKRIISPLLPPACRFVPTCSSYGVQAIQEFGPTKGCVLIAWRILRCSPFGGKGYDPPKWPPVAYTYSSY
jgi:uncharacterized protein